MTCAEVNGLLDRLMDGELTDEEQRAMEAHGRECPDCSEAIRATVRMKALFDGMEPEADVPLAAQAKWRGAVREAAKQKKRARLIRWVGSAAAAVVVLAGVGLAMNLKGAPARDARNAAAQIVEAGEAGEAGEAAQIVEAGEAGEADEAAGSAANVAGEASEKATANSAGEASESVIPDSAGEASEAAPGSADEAGAGSAYEAEAAYDSQIDGAYKAEPERAAAADKAAEAPPRVEVAAETAPRSAAEAGEAGEAAPVTAEAEEDLSDADDAVLETDGESANMCAALAQRAPACELRFRVEDPDRALAMVCDLASEYEAETDVQLLDGGGTNVYVEIAAAEAEAFLKAVAPVGTPEGEARLSDAGAATTVLMLIELLPQ